MSIDELIGPMRALAGILGRELVRFPVTVTLCLVSLWVYVKLRKLGEPRTPQDWSRWRLHDLAKVRSGAWWGLWTEPMKHTSPPHLAISIAAVALMGSSLEAHLGSPLYVAFTLAAFTVASLTQLAAFDVLVPGLHFVALSYAALGLASGLLDGEELARHRTGALCAVVQWASFGSSWWERHRWPSLLPPAASGAFGVLAGRAIAGPTVATWLALVALAAALAASLRWRPWSVPWRYERAWNALQSGDFSRACRGFGRLRARFPDDESLAVVVCRCLFAAGRENEYRGALESVRARDPGLAQDIELHSVARSLAAAALATESQPRLRALAEARIAGFDLRVRRSRELCRQLLLHAPEDFEAQIEFARSIAFDPYVGADELELALESAEHAVDRSGGRSAEAWIALGIVAAVSGDDELARQSLESLDSLVAESDPLSPTAAYERDWLRTRLAPSTPVEAEPAT